MTESGNVKVEQVFDRMALRFDRQMQLFERYVLGAARRWAVAHARGRVVELAVGTGVNLQLYGPDVEHVVGVDLSEGMLDIARQRKVNLRLDRVELCKGDVQKLELPDSSADTVISTYSFCAIPEPTRASREAWRVLVPGGRFVLAEHGPSTNRAIAWAMRLVDPAFVRFGADHITRDPVPFLRDAGFEIDSVERTGRGGITFRVLAHKSS